MNRRVLKHVECLLNRIEYNDRCDEQKGVNSKRLQETLAIEFALDVIEGVYPAEVQEAERRKERA